MKKDAKFFFANLGADVARCASAAQEEDEQLYSASLGRAHKTLEYLRAANRPEAYEEGLLLLRGLQYAREDKTLARFRSDLNRLIAPFAVVRY
jgi:hypothetical protein